MSVTADRYPWVTKVPLNGRVLSPTRPSNPGPRAGRAFLDQPCATCGWSPIGWRKRCPACLAQVDR